jgi:hypothetical protein
MCAFDAAGSGLSGLGIGGFCAHLIACSFVP